MGKIVAIGGGSMSELETLRIDREIVGLAGKWAPRALLIPTASYDRQAVYDDFKKVYGKRLGCKTDVLYVLKQQPSKRTLRAKILTSDIVYVSGGNTLKMMRRWRRLGIDRLLRTAHRNGTVLSGTSAGAICWFAHGHSDSMSFYNPDDWDYIRVKALGLVDLVCCPHYDGEKRDRSFREMVSKHKEVGIALDNRAALEIIDDRFRIIASKNGPCAYRIYRKGLKILTETLPPGSRFRPLSHLPSDRTRGRID